MRTYKEENSSSMFSTEILQENTEAAIQHGHHSHITEKFYATDQSKLGWTDVNAVLFRQQAALHHK